MADKSTDVIEQYQAFVRQGVEAWAKQFDPTAAAVDAPSPDIAGRLFAGLSSYGDWLRSFTSGEPQASPFAQGMPPFGQPGPAAAPFGYGPPPGAQPGSEGFDDWVKVALEALSMPALGITREQQEEQQALLRAWIDYAGHYARYQALLKGVHDRANATLHATGMPPGADSLRAVYDHWVNLAEQNYAEAALSAEFREVYAALVNAQMRLKVLQQGQVERMAVQAGMPTRSEVNSLGERLQAVRRELRQMQGLAAEVEALRAEFAASRGKAPKATTRQATAKKATAKKAPKGRAP
jgi:polyhydroxyalkanoate synthesis regulator phasin